LGWWFSFSNIEVAAELAEHVREFAIALKSFGMCHCLVRLPAGVLLARLLRPFQVLVKHQKFITSFRLTTAAAGWSMLKDRIYGVVPVVPLGHRR
jgi:hypothetical protein